MKCIKNYGNDGQKVEAIKLYNEKWRTQGYFEGVNKQPIYYECYTVPVVKGHIVISHGFCECLLKYTELIYYFLKEGYCVYALEHRGHGRTGWLGIDQSQIHVDDFQDYIEDLHFFITHYVPARGKHYLFAHSMGGCIGARYLECYPDTFDKAILCSPMLEIHTGNCPEVLARQLAAAYCAMGKEKAYVFGNKPFDLTFDLEQSGTSSVSRYDYHSKELTENPHLLRGGGSFGWLHSAFKTIDALQKPSAIARIKCPVLVFQAGQDTYVRAKGQKQFVAKGKHMRLVRIVPAKHEIYFEREPILQLFLNQIFAFLKEA